ncbi:MAG: hypothetical protein ACXIVQ_16220 [Acidimicrobiales bacterium]
MTASPSSALARVVLIAVASALLATALLPLLIVRDLPDPLATRWGLDGEVTATMSEMALTVLVLVLVVPCAGTLFVLAATRREALPASRTMWAGAVAMVGAVIASAVMMTLVANSGVETGQQVPGPAIWQVAAVVVVSLALGALTAWAAPGPPHERLVAPVPQPLAVGDEATVAWSKELSVRWLMAVGAVTSAAGAVLLVVSADVWIGLVVIASGVPAVLLSRIEVFADCRGLTVTYGPGRWPRTLIPAERIAVASAVDVVPAEWGGWGYRGSVRLFRHGAVVLRAGPGIRVDLADGRRFAVTIDDPETAAAVLNREVARAGR